MKTKIHGKMYDLTKFNHPGGIIPMYLIENNDGTCLFESYHPVSNRDALLKILEKYEINDDNSIEEQKVYDFNNFKNDPFVKELREKVYDYFKELSIKNNCTIIEATKMNTNKFYETIILFIILSFGFYLNLGIIYTSFFHFLLVINNWHDIGHFSFIKNKKLEMYMMPLFTSLFPTFSWYIGHTRNHHSYTNIVNLDQDLDEYFITNTKKRNLFLDILRIPFVVFIKIFFSNNENDLLNLQFKYYYNIQLFLHVTFKFFLFLYIFFTNSSYILSAIKIILYYLIQLIFFGLFTKINHIHTNNFTKDKNFYKHQIITSSNLKTNSYIYRLLSGSLNCQIEHHLFPSVNSCHLPALAKIIKPLCLKYNINYNESFTLCDALSDTLKSIKSIKSLKTLCNIN